MFIEKLVSSGKFSLTSRRVTVHREDNQDTTVEMAKKEGLLSIRSRNLIGVRSWQKRHFVLLDDALLVYTRGKLSSTKLPVKELFLTDVDQIERAENKNQPFSILISTEERRYKLACCTYEDREDWITVLWKVREEHKKLELDPVIRRSTVYSRSARARKHYKKVVVKKDPESGIGCSIKNVAGMVYVSKIIPGGPLSECGSIKPGDQIIDIDGVKVTNLAIEDIREMIRQTGKKVVFTINPVTFYKAEASPTITRTRYTQVDHSTRGQTDKQADNQAAEAADTITQATDIPTSVQSSNNSQTADNKHELEQGESSRAHTSNNELSTASSVENDKPNSEHPSKDSTNLQQTESADPENNNNNTKDDEFDENSTNLPDRDASIVSNASNASTVSQPNLGSRSKTVTSYAELVFN